MIETFLPYSEANKKSFYSDVLICRMLVKTFGKRSLRQISPQMIEEFKQNSLRLPTKHGHRRSPASGRRERRRSSAAGWRARIDRRRCTPRRDARSTRAAGESCRRAAGRKRSPGRPRGGARGGPADLAPRLIRRAASYPEVARIFVHPPIKKELCRWATGDRSWLAKVRPYYGHNYHFHIRIKCPNGGCKDQFTPRPNDGTGCGDELAYWYSEKPWRAPKRDPNAKPSKPPKPMTITALPAACRAVVTVE